MALPGSLRDLVQAESVLCAIVKIVIAFISDFDSRLDERQAERIRILRVSYIDRASNAMMRRFSALLMLHFAEIGQEIGV